MWKWDNKGTDEFHNQDRANFNPSSQPGTGTGNWSVARATRTQFPVLSAPWKSPFLRFYRRRFGRRRNDPRDSVHFANVLNRAQPWRERRAPVILADTISRPRRDKSSAGSGGSLLKSQDAARNRFPGEHRFETRLARVPTRVYAYLHETRRAEMSFVSVSSRKFGKVTWEGRIERREFFLV